MSLGIEKLFDYATEHGLKIIWIDKVPGLLAGSLGCYFLQDKEIFLKDSLKCKNLYTWFVLAHEIGHHIDTEERTLEYSNTLSAAYSVFTSCYRLQVETPKEARKFIINAETRASDYGIELIRDLDLPIVSRDLKKWKRQVNNSYRRLFKGKSKWKKMNSLL